MKKLGLKNSKSQSLFSRISHSIDSACAIYLVSSAIGKFISAAGTCVTLEI